MNTENVIITGFGPFGEHKINTSWEAVKLLPQFDFPAKINLIIEEIPVVYNYIDTHIPELWKTYNPKLVVHVGVSSEAKKITLEHQAHRSGYCKTDCENNKHITGEICTSDSGIDCIETKLDINQICSIINENCELESCVSTNAGRYLCEFTYYKSLHIDDKRTLFIHVPPLDKPYTAKQLAAGIAQIINSALKQLDHPQQ